jgi:altronate dehydratase small subunit
LRKTADFRIYLRHGASEIPDQVISQPYRGAEGCGMVPDRTQTGARAFMRRDAIVIKRQDNVATAIRDIPANKSAIVGIEDETLTLLVIQPIALGHKLALRPIKRGEDVLKYAAVIGRATQDIAAGEHVHVHNVESTRGRGDLA